MALKILQSSDKAKGLCKLLIDEDLTIYEIEKIKQAVTKEFKHYQTFELDLSGTEEVDSAGIQLLLALRVELIRQKKELKLTALSHTVSKLMGSYSVNDRFNLGTVL